MDVTLGMPPSSAWARNRRVIIAFIAIEGLLIVAGAALNIPPMGLAVPVLLGAAYLGNRPLAILAVLFMAFSVALHVSVFSGDNAVFALLALVWWRTASHVPAYDRLWKRARVFAWLSIAWTAVAALRSTLFDGGDVYALAIGVNLIEYFAYFVIAQDVLQSCTQAQREWLLRFAWGIALVVCTIALVQRFMLDMQRVSSVLESHHSHLGNYSLGSVLIGVAVLARSRTRTARLLTIGGLLVCVIAMLVSETRADLTGAGVGCLAYVAVRGWRAAMWVGLAVLVLIATGVGPGIVRSQIDKTFKETDETVSRVSAGYDASAIDRVMIWVGILDLERHSPVERLLAGFGPGRFPDFTRPYMDAFAMFSYEKQALAGHNNALHMMVEVGLIGLILMCAMFYYILRQLYRFSRSRIVKVRETGAMAFAVTIALLASGMTQETFYAQPAMGNFFGMYMVVLALLYALSRADDAAPTAAARA